MLQPREPMVSTAGITGRIGRSVVVAALVGALSACLSPDGVGTSSDATTVPTGGGTSAGSGDTPSTTENTIPVAKPDSVTVDDGMPATLNLLANDTGLENEPVTLTLAANPAHGTVSINTDNTIVYTADSGYSGADSLTYRITDADSETAIANVSIQVTCASCPVERLVTLSWNPNSDTVTGYQIFRGPTAEQATQLLTDLPLNSGLVDPTAPKAEYRATDLGLATGEQACFRVKAYNNDSFSAFSQAVCGAI